MKKKILAAVMAATMVFSLVHAAPLMQAATQQPEVQAQQPEVKTQEPKVQAQERPAPAPPEI